MKVYPFRSDMMMLELQKHPEDPAPWGEVREVPDELIARFESLHEQLDRVSEEIEQAYKSAAQ